MALKSDLFVDAAKFRASSVSEATKAVNASIIDIGARDPKWWELGAPKFREMRRKGETAFPAPVILQSGSEAFVPSREQGRQIRLRVHEPETGKPRGVFMHIHGGGWVLFDEDCQDGLLKFIADSAQVTVVSVGYRLAPENPYPAGPEDCHDVAEWLIDHAESKFGAELCYIGGESAGAHLSVNTCFHLIKTRPAFQFKGLVLLYGVYDLAQHLPQVYHFDKPLILQRVDMDHFIEAFCPGMDIEKRRDPAISPFYANLYDLAGKTPSGKLPPAFFAVGTWDCLLDDTMFFANKWLMSGSEAVVKVYPGAPHGFSTFPPASLEACQEMREHLIEFMSQ